MKTGIKLLAAAALLILTTVSCTKIPKPLADSDWYGEYPAQIQDGTTGETEERTALIMLSFSENGKTCIVDRGYVGSLSINRSKYSVRWSSENTFLLCQTQGDQVLVEYAGTLHRNKMSLEAMNCDSVAAAYQLTRKR